MKNKRIAYILTGVILLALVAILVFFYVYKDVRSSAHEASVTRDNSSTDIYKQVQKTPAQTQSDVHVAQSPSVQNTPSQTETSRVRTMPSHGVPYCAPGSTSGETTCAGFDSSSTQVLTGMVTNSNPATVWFAYRKKGSTEWIATRHDTLTSGTSGQFSLLLDRLTSNTQYQFEAYAQQDGVTYRGEILEFTL